MTQAERRLLLAIARFQLGNGGRLRSGSFDAVVEELHAALGGLERQPDGARPTKNLFQPLRDWLKD